ncbi:MAG TPA: selenocysteine-specific translation elongation factor [Gemmatimonadaceae bacterium]|nr:selenocysteine-specific translation elongation factor [Gemmatimonadaceae bacterium]
MILGTAGHIDHGKTALVKALTGVDTDRLPEEKRRGITIDLGFAPLEIPDLGTIGIVDVPGHEGFIRTMLAGASGIDLAMLVVAADEGVMPQTREHLDILSLLGIERGVIALTKCDLADDEWRSLVCDDIRTLCAGTFLSNSEIVQVSSVTGSGIVGLRDAIACIARSVEKKRADDLFRMPVDRSFSVRGTGTVVTGTVWSGSVSVNDSLRIEPGGREVRVRGVQSHSKSLQQAMPGARTAIALASCTVEDAARGTNLVAHRDWVPSQQLDVLISLVDSDFSPTPRARVRIHLGTAETGARLSRLRPAEDGQLSSRLVLDEPMLARSGDRFVIRTPSPAATVGGGSIVDPYPLRSNKTPHREVVLLERLREILDEAGARGVVRSVLPIRTGAAAEAIAAALAESGAIIVGDLVIGRSAERALEEFVQGFIALHMANHPLEDGVSLQTLRAASKASSQVIDFVLSRLVESGAIEVSGSTVKPAGWESRLSEKDQALSDAILHAICNAGSEPPSVAELEIKFGSMTPVLVRWLERRGELRRVSEDRYYSRDVVEGMVESLRTGSASGRKYTPSELKDVLGVSRKFLIPFLEFCDKTGVTERSGDGRVVKGAVRASE